MNTSRQHGFTLWELLMTLLVAGILLGIGVPNVMEFQRNGAMTGAANDLVTALLMARTEAVKRQAPVTWCLTDDPLAATPTCSLSSVVNSDTRGYIVWVDENDNRDATGARILTDATDRNGVVNNGETVIRRTVAPGGRIRLSASCGYASFSPTGVLRQLDISPAPCNPAFPAASPSRVVFFCDDRGRRPSSGNLSSARAVRIDPVGRANAYQELADVNLRFAAVSPLGATCALPP
jgi:prepilin-type N-terminal cleavage/methylation domain-containing protein